MINMFYNTTKETGKDLEVCVKKAKTQDEIIYNLFYEGSKLSPSQIDTILEHRYPITSIRRSLNTLAKRGMLTRLDVKMLGKYGRKEGLYQK